MTQPHHDDNLNYEEYVDGLRRSNAELMLALKLHHASHVAFEHGDDVESEKQHALAVDATRAIIAKSHGGASVTAFESEGILYADEATARTAFHRAIAAGILSDAAAADNAAAAYMFMGTMEEGDAFKHVDTRQYIYNKRSAAS